MQALTYKFNTKSEAYLYIGIGPSVFRPLLQVEGVVLVCLSKNAINDKISLHIKNCIYKK